MAWQVFKVFAAYAIGILALWAAVTIAVAELMKSRSGRQSTKRQKKLYIHSIEPKGEKVK